MIATAYFRAFVSASELGPLPPFRDEDRVGFITQNRQFIWEEPLSDDAVFTTWQGRQYACPRNVQVRMVEGILAFAHMNPAMRLLSESERRGYKAELDRLRRGSAHGGSHILSSAWHVPLRWFSAFRASDREVYEDGNATSIRYRTSTGDAIDRVRWATSVLTGAGFPELVVDRVRGLERWISEFSADSMVELDYAAVAGYFSEADLVFDDSADDIRASLLALEAGDFDASRDAYQKVALRWSAAQSYLLSN